MTPEQQTEAAISQRTQQLLAERIGMLLISNARLQAEAEAWAEKVRAAADPPPPPEA